MKRYIRLSTALIAVLLLSACGASSTLQAEYDALLAENELQTKEIAALNEVIASLQEAPEIVVPTAQYAAPEYNLEVPSGYTLHTLTVADELSFVLYLALPSNWTVQETTDIEQQAGYMDGFIVVEELGKTNRTAFSIYDESNTWIGAIGYTTLDETAKTLETTALGAFYWPVSLANHFHLVIDTIDQELAQTGRLAYQSVVNDNGFVVGTTTGYYWLSVTENDGDVMERFTKAILSHNIELGVMIAIEFEETSLTEDELGLIAGNLLY